MLLGIWDIHMGQKDMTQGLEEACAVLKQWLVTHEHV